MKAPLLLGLGAFGAFAAYLLSRKKVPSSETSSAAEASAPEAGKPALSKEEIEGKPELIAKAPPGFTRNVGVLPPEAGGFARQGLSKPYGAITGPQVLSDGRTYVGVTESHFDDHVTNPRTGQKDKHWHKGVSLFVQA